MKNFLDLLGNLDRRSQAQPPPAAVPITFPPEVWREINRAVRPLVYSDTVYGSDCLPEGDYRTKVTRDLAVKYLFGNLKRVALEFIAHDGTILAAHEVLFGQSTDPRRPYGSVHAGAPTPVLDRSKIARTRFVVTTLSTDESAYRAHLAFQWTSVEALAQQPGDDFEDPRQARRSRGRQHARLHVSAGMRREFVCTRSGDKYAFGDVPELGLVGVFIHRDICPGGRLPRTGERWTGQVVTVAGGVQMHAARPKSPAHSSQGGSRNV